MLLSPRHHDRAGWCRQGTTWHHPALDPPTSPFIHSVQALLFLTDLSLCSHRKRAIGANAFYARCHDLRSDPFFAFGLVGEVIRHVLSGVTSNRKHPGRHVTPEWWGAIKAMFLYTYCYYCCCVNCLWGSTPRHKQTETDGTGISSVTTVM